VESLVGLDPAVAEGKIRDLHLTVVPTHDKVTGPCTSGVPGAAAITVTKGKVCTQDPSASTQLEEGKPVSFTIYGGPANVTVPAVTNLQLADAQKQLSGQQLQAKVKYVNGTDAAGTVTDQDPPAFTSVVPGSAVTLSVSNGKSKLPDVRGKSYDDARTALQNAGWLTVKSEDGIVAAPYKVGQVMAMNPAQASAVDPKTTIVLTVAVPVPLPSCTPTTTPPTSPSGSASPSSTPSTAPSSTAAGTAAPTCTN